MNTNNVNAVAVEIKAFIRTKFTKRATESDIREFFEDGDILDQWIDDDFATQEEAEEAFEIAIASYVDRMEIAA